VTRIRFAERPTVTASGRWCRVLAWACLWTVLWVGPVAALEVIVHPSTQRPTLERHVLQAIYGMRLTRWGGDGQPVTVFVLPPDSPLHREFTLEKLHMLPYQLSDAWERMVFTGTGQAPQVVPDVPSMVRRVAETPGSIGYCPEKDLIPEVHRVEIR
jgi:hypothetical protein